MTRPAEPNSETSDTRRRAKNRGREAVARWRIESGVWSGRLFAVIFSVIAVLPLVNGWREAVVWKSAVSSLVIAAAIFYATEKMRAGSRAAACILLALFVAAKRDVWLLTDQPPWASALWTIIIAGGLATGVWGTFALAAARRDAASIPPAPPRPDRDQ